MIFTDGEPNGGSKLFEAELTKLVTKKSTQGNFKVQIMACTDDEDAVGYLNRIDKNFESVDVTDDYYSEKQEVLLKAKKREAFTRGDWLLKAMLGPISTKFDGWDEGKKNVLGWHEGVQVAQQGEAEPKSEEKEVLMTVALLVVMMMVMSIDVSEPDYHEERAIAIVVVIISSYHHIIIIIIVIGSRAVAIAIVIVIINLIIINMIIVVINIIVIINMNIIIIRIVVIIIMISSSTVVIVIAILIVVVIVVVIVIVIIMSIHLSLHGNTYGRPRTSQAARSVRSSNCPARSSPAAFSSHAPGRHDLRSRPGRGVPHPKPGAGELLRERHEEGSRNKVVYRALAALAAVAAIAAVFQLGSGLGSALRGTETKMHSPIQLEESCGRSADKVNLQDVIEEKGFPLCVSVNDAKMDGESLNILKHGWGYTCPVS
eukprot:s823_g1.t1